MPLSTGEGLNYKTNIRHGSKKALVRVEVVFRPNCVIEQVNILNIIFVCVFVKKVSLCVLLHWYFGSELRHRASLNIAK